MKDSDDNKRNNIQDNRIGKDNDYNPQTSNSQNQIRQSEQAVDRTLEDTRNNINRLTNEARREISKSTEKMKEYQEDSLNIINNIANNYIESQKELFTSFSDSITGNNTNRLRNNPQTSWLNYYSPERFAQIYGENVNSFTNSMIRYGNLLNNLSISNMNYFKSFLQQMELYSKEFSEREVGRR
jgi:hypothetical protein